MPLVHTLETGYERARPFSREAQCAVCRGQRMLEIRRTHTVVCGTCERCDAEAVYRYRFVVVHDVPADCAARRVTIRARSDHVDRIRAVQRDRKPERERSRFVAEDPVGMQLLQRPHKVECSLALRQRAPVRRPCIDSLCRADGLSLLHLAAQAFANARVRRHDARRSLLGTREEGGHFLVVGFRHRATALGARLGQVSYCLMARRDGSARCGWKCVKNTFAPKTRHSCCGVFWERRCVPEKGYNHRR